MTTQAGAVLVTGCGSGIGRAAAFVLADRGFDVVAGVRAAADVERLRESARDRAAAIDVRILDLAEQDAMPRIVEDIVSDHGGLYALINNGGIAQFDVFEQESMDEFRRVIEVNLLGTVALTKLALPHLRALTGRIITVSSVGGAIGQPFNEAYCASKFALEGVFETLAAVAREVGVRVSLVEPGPVATNLTAHIDLARKAEAAGPYEAVLRRFLDTASDPARTPFQGGQQPEEVAEQLADILADPNPRLRYQTSRTAREMVVRKLSDLNGEAMMGYLGSWLSRSETQ